MLSPLLSVAVRAERPKEEAVRTQSHHDRTPVLVDARVGVGGSSTLRPDLPSLPLLWS